MIGSKQLGKSVLTAAVIMATAITAGGVNAQGTRERENKNQYVADQVIVVYKDKISDSGIRKTAAVKDAQVSETGNLGDGSSMAVMDISKDDTVDEAVDKFSDDSRVAYAQPNYIYKAQAVPDYVSDVKADVAAADVASTKKIKVAVIDTGFDTSDSTIASRMNKTASIAVDVNGNTKKLVSEKNSHGTLVAKALLNTGGSNTDLMAVDASDDGETFTTSSITRAMDYAVDKGARIVNLSFGGISSDKEDNVLDHAVTGTTKEGALVICSAGNDGTSRKFYPASSSKALAVIGLDENAKTKADFSNYGNTKNKISAPSVNIIGYESGTSFSAPIVSGVAAQVIARNSGLSPAQTKSILEKTADDLNVKGYDNVTGYGRVNAKSAVLEAGTTKVTAPTGITLSAASMSLKAGTIGKLTAAVLPSNTTDPSVSWSSSNQSVATVDSSGNVLAKSAGTAVITARNNSGTYKTSKVTVTGASAAQTTNSTTTSSAAKKTSVSLSREKITGCVGAETNLQVRVQSPQQSRQCITWSSSDPSVAKVDTSGNVVLRSEGKAKIYAFTPNGAMDSAVVEVSRCGI